MAPSGAAVVDGPDDASASASAPSSPSSLARRDGAEARRRRFDADVASMREGTRLYLRNDFRAAEDLFRRGMAGGASPPAAGAETGGDGGKCGGDPEEEREVDLRGAFALQYAIVGLLRGVASMEDDQLDDCLSRLWEADRLASLDVPWVGRSLIRGLCYLVAGIVECLRKRPAQGALHVAASWRWLRSLRTEALQCEGMGKEVVRSSALLGLGAFALVLSMLPSKLVGAASFVTGFEVERSAGLRMLRTCQEEGDVYAPIGALGWIAFQVDTKSFLGEEQSEEDLAECERMLAWAAEQFEDSLFFGILEADFHAVRRRLPAALEVLDRAMALPCLDELRALKAMLSYKVAIYHLALLQWSEAAEAFETSQKIYKAAGRRSLGPSMAISAAHCYCVAGGVDARDKMKCMMDEVAAYKAMDKSNWVGGDRQAFRAHSKYVERIEEDPNDDLRPWSLLHLATAMALIMRCTLWMSPAEGDRLVALLDDAGYDADDAARAAVCVAQLHAHRGTIREGLDRCRAGLDLAPVLGEASRKFGTVPTLRYLAAHLHCAAGSAHRAEANLRRSAKETTSDMTLHHYLAFKTSQLQRRVEELLEASYSRVDIPARSKALLSVDLSRRSSDANGDGGSGDGNDSAAEEQAVVVGWDWYVEGRDVDFSARFVPSSKYAAAPIWVVRKARHNSDGPVEGEFRLPAGCGAGTLELAFSNEYSYLRGKVVTYKLTLPPNARVTKS